jgi:hypothetical protein
MATVLGTFHTPNTCARCVATSIISLPPTTISFTKPSATSPCPPNPSSKPPPKRLPTRVNVKRRMRTSNRSNEAAVAPRPRTTTTTTSTPKTPPRPISRTKQPRQEEREERRQQKAGGRKAPLPQGTSCTPSMAIAPSIVCSFPPISNPLTYLHRKTTQNCNCEDAALKSPPRSKQTA